MIQFHINVLKPSATQSNISTSKKEKSIKKCYKKLSEERSTQCTQDPLFRAECGGIDSAATLSTFLEIFSVEQTEYP